MHTCFLYLGMWPSLKTVPRWRYTVWERFSMARWFSFSFSICVTRYPGNKPRDWFWQPREICLLYFRLMSRTAAHHLHHHYTVIIYHFHFRLKNSSSVPQLLLTRVCLHLLKQQMSRFTAENSVKCCVSLFYASYSFLKVGLRMWMWPIT